MRKTVILIITLIFVFIISEYLDLKIVGSIKTKKYHYSFCQTAKKIHKDDLVIFRSRVDARSAGYKSCEICIPPDILE